MKKIHKLLELLAAGQFSKIFNALKIRASGLLPWRESLKHEVYRHRHELARVLSEYFDCDNKYRSGTIKTALVIRGGDIMPQSSAFIRLIAPLTHPDISSEVSIKLYPEDTTQVDKDTDICIVQRTAFSNKLAASKLVKHLDRAGTKLILDTDDAFSRLDPGHPQHGEQARKVKALEFIVDRADQIWLSTGRLSSAYSNKPKHVVMQNSLDERMWQVSEKIAPNGNGVPIRMVYMGTATHDEDLAMIMPVLDKIAVKHPGLFQLTIVGVADKLNDRPWLRRIRQEKFGAMYPNFVRWFMGLGPFDIGLSPLADNDFNRAKSDIKCLDYLAAGIVPVVSDIKPYQNQAIAPLIIKVKNTETDWVGALESIVGNPEAFRAQKPKIIAEGNRYIWAKRSTRQSSKAILRLIKQLV